MRGRPTKSVIRQNIIEIINVKKKVYGYELYTYYIDIFPKVHIRSVYYHLKKGVALKELEIKEVKEEKGNYSWGDKAEKVYYTLGSNARPKNSKRVLNYFLKKSE
ncbi:hypothetical protein HN592_05885 [Candidatus Woesearchaeota archaeon]|jgi:hypothetical protein|nr:hypothetical protein [Candidatus Woesearchaeota archaeon]MBT3304786.1 hypothetical protein [Candidatus Woesearchaeota archaeon]MBT4367878.1 hypothetical protein [Candidatus Woesearchaeota archaeon]MBT4712366.1 hypothetical protein [Candidatus Woesearchaeota archaeon]MBT6639278.1 hypothetical protein [Candidatus Woesearchaeota archaeon]